MAKYIIIEVFNFENEGIDENAYDRWLEMTRRELSRFGVIEKPKNLLAIGPCGHRTNVWYLHANISVSGMLIEKFETAINFYIDEDYSRWSEKL